MTTYTGTQNVKGGYYLNLNGWNMEAVNGKAGVLPGDESARYVRVPMLALLVVAPLLGLGFVVVLPFLGLAVLGEQGWHKATQAAAARRAAATRTPSPTTVRRH